MSVTGFLRDTPIKRKVTLVILLTSAVALFLLGSALITYEFITFRRGLAVNISVLGQIIGSNSTAALAFQDAKSANEILGALSAEHQVTAAALYDDKGQIFARFPADAPMTNFPAKPAPDGSRFGNRRLEMFRPIEQEGSRLGTIYLQADLGAMYARFEVYGALLLVVTACAALGSIALTTPLQETISRPIVELANVATAVSERQDYSVRAQKRGQDEIGQLTDAFNQMLIRIGESSTALMASEERLRLALEGSSTGTWDWNLATGHLIWDDYMYPLFGRRKDEFAGTIDSVLNFVHADDRVRVREETERAVTGDGRIHIDFRVVDPDGSVRHMTSRGRVFYDTQRRPMRVTGVNMDITASKRNEEDLSKAKEAAEAANKAKDNFLAILSHELRTPLTPVLSVVAMLEEDQRVAPHILNELEMIRRNIEVEARLIDDLLDVTAIIRGKLELNRQVVDVRSLLEHAMENYCSANAAQKDLRVAMNFEAKQTHVMADGSRLTQVLWNLLQNACKFTPVGGAIDIHVFNPAGSPDIDTVIVEIADTGIGISPENMPRIFNAFEQGERARTRVFGGLGLGLAISRAIVEMHGGSVRAESAGRDKGTRMIICLPTVAAPVSPAAARGMPAPGSSSSRSLRILLVEDHADTARQLTRLLQRAGHKVVAASSIKEARELIGSEPAGQFNILISDLGLPDGSGHELMRDLVQHHQPIPGIALSGYGMKEDIRQSMEAGFARHLTKPVDWQELKGAIQRIADA